MIEIIPSINVRTFEEVQERIRKVEPYAKWCHLDVTDGVFSKHLTWHDPRDLLKLDTSLNIEVHLMILDPEKIIDQWLVKPVNPVRSKTSKASADSFSTNRTSNGVKRLIFHIETMNDPELIIKKCRDAGVEVGFAINPETFWGKLEPWFGKIDIYQTLAVHPGPSGQKLTEDIYDKISHIRQSCLRCIIEVDGGINQETAKKAVNAGANLLVAGNYLFSSPDIKQAIENLKYSEVQPL